MTAPEPYTGKPNLNRFRELARHDKRVAVLEQASSHRRTAQAEVVVENLTKDPNWDVFLSIIQAEIERCDAGEKLDLEKVMNPSIDSDSALEARGSALLCRERAKALRWVQELPRILREDSRAAKKIIKKYDLG